MFILILQTLRQLAEELDYKFTEIKSTHELLF